MKTTVTEPTACTRIIECEVEAEIINKKADAKLAEYSKKANVKGFRPGKVPMSVAKQRWAGAARAEAIEDVVNDAYKTACEEHKIVPVCGASVSDMSGGEDENSPLKFKIETEVDPHVEIANYDKLKVKAKPKKIKDADVDEAYDRFIAQYAEYPAANAPAKKGNCVKIEYQKVVIDGEEKPEFKNHNPGHAIEIGDEKGLKDFDKGLIGASAGDVKEITVKFPKDYYVADIAGKTGDFTVKILEVLDVKMPDVTPEFLKQFGEFETVDAFKEMLRKRLEDEEKVRAKREAHQAAIAELIEANPFDVPPSKITTFVDMMLEDFAKECGGNLPAPREELAERYRPEAINALKRIRIVDYVANKENIKATQEEVDKEIEIMAQMYQQNFDELKQLFRQNGMTNRIRSELRERKTLDFLIGEK